MMDGTTTAYRDSASIVFTLHIGCRYAVRDEVFEKDYKRYSLSTIHTYLYYIIIQLGKGIRIGIDCRYVLFVRGKLIFASNICR